MSFMAYFINTKMDTNSLQVVSIFKQKQNFKFSHSGWPKQAILRQPLPDPTQVGDLSSGVRFETLNDLIKEEVGDGLSAYAG